MRGTLDGGRFAVATVGMLTLFLSACAFADKGDLIGTYRLEAVWGRAQLTLYPDGHFTETVWVRGKESQISGKWSFFEKRTVSLQPCLNLNLEGALEPSDLCSYPVNWNLGKLQIYIDEDVGLGFTK